MSNSVIYTANTNTQSVAVDGTIALGTIVRRFGSNLNMSGNGINVNGAGYYKVTASVTAEATAIGDVSISLYNDGVEVAGATATETASVAGNSVNLSIVAVVREMCCEPQSVLTLVLTAGASSVTNVALAVEKL